MTLLNVRDAEQDKYRLPRSILQCPQQKGLETEKEAK